MQRDTRREQIVAAGLELFVRRGYAATRISDIAEAASMSTGLLFHYFESKQSLYEELIQAALGRAAAATEPTPSADPLGYFERLAATVIDALRMSASAAQMFVLVSRADADAVLGHDLIANATRSTLRRTADVVRLGQQAGVIRGGDALALATAFWGALQGIAQLAVAQSKPAYPEADWIVDMLRASGGRSSGGTEL